MFALFLLALLAGSWRTAADVRTWMQDSERIVLHVYVSGFRNSNSFFFASFLPADIFQALCLFQKRLATPDLCWLASFSPAQTGRLRWSEVDADQPVQASLIF